MQPENINDQYAKAYAVSSLRIWDKVAIGGILVFGSAIFIGVIAKVTLFAFIGVFGLLSTSVAAIIALQMRRQGNLSVLIQPDSSVPNNLSQVFALPKAGRKYIYEIATFSLLSLGAIGLFGTPIYFVLNASNFKPDYYYVIAVLFAVGFGALAGLITMLVQSIRELNLYEVTRNKEVDIANGELKVSIVLLEGNPRADLRKQNKSYKCLPLAEIKEFSVEAVGQAYGGIRLPAYYVVTLANEPKNIFILRWYFKGIEENFLSALKTKINVPIIVKDTLYK